MTLHVEPTGTFRGSITVPGDKSRSHRAVLISALAPGTSQISGVSAGEDVGRTVAIVHQLGAHVHVVGRDIAITGPEGGLTSIDEVLACGNSGTTMRLLCGALASVAGQHRLSGDASLSARPMDRVARPLSLMGLDIAGRGERLTPPLTVSSRGRTQSITYDVPEPSAQVKSAILLAALAGDAPTTVHERVRTRTATEEMLSDAGIEVDVETGESDRTVRVSPGRPHARDWRIPGDPSQASFFLVGALLHADGDVVVEGLDDGPERWGFLAVLERMGATVARHGRDHELAVTARSSDLLATDVDASEIPSLDEVPILAVAAAAASGTSRFHGVGELRVKESDRLAGTVELINGLGARAIVDGDSLVVTGLGSATRFDRAQIDGHDDHRMVMAASIAGAVGRGADIEGAETVATSFPDFVDVLAKVGA